MIRRPDPDEARGGIGDDQRYLRHNRLVGALTLMGPLDPLLAAVLRELRLHELAEHTVPAVAAAGAQSLDGEHR